MGKQRIRDAARISVGYVVNTANGDAVGFHTLEGVKTFVRNTGAKYFYAYDVNNEENVVRLMSIYINRYRESDIEDRLIANKQQGGESYFVKKY